MASYATGAPGAATGVPGGAAQPCSAEFQAAFICLNTQPPGACGCFDIMTFEEDLQSRTRENFMGTMAFAAPSDPAFCGIANDRVCEFYNTQQSCCCQAETEAARRCFVETVVINEMPMPLSGPCMNDCSPKVEDNGGGGGGGGVVVIILLLLAAIGGAGYWWWRRRKLLEAGKELTLPMFCPCLSCILGDKDDDDMSHSKSCEEGFSVREISYRKKKKGRSGSSGSGSSSSSTSSHSKSEFSESTKRKKVSPRLTPSKSHRLEEESKNARRKSDSSFVSNESDSMRSSDDEDERLNSRPIKKGTSRNDKSGPGSDDNRAVKVLMEQLEATSTALHGRMAEYQRELERVKREKDISGQRMNELVEDRMGMAHRMAQLEQAQMEQAAKLRAAENERLIAERRIAELEARNSKLSSKASVQSSLVGENDEYDKLRQIEELKAKNKRLSKELKRSSSASKLHELSNEELFEKEKRIAELEAQNKRLGKELKKSGSQSKLVENFEDEFSTLPIPREITAKNKKNRNRGDDLRRVASDSHLEIDYDDYPDNSSSEKKKKKKSHKLSRDPSVICSGYPSAEESVDDPYVMKKSKKKHRKSYVDPPM